MLGRKTFRKRFFSKWFFCNISFVITYLTSPVITFLTSTINIQRFQNQQQFSKFIRRDNIFKTYKVQSFIMAAEPLYCWNPILLEVRHTAGNQHLLRQWRASGWRYVEDTIIKSIKTVFDQREEFGAITKFPLEAAILRSMSVQAFPWFDVTYCDVDVSRQRHDDLYVSRFCQEDRVEFDSVFKYGVTYVRVKMDLEITCITL